MPDCIDVDQQTSMEDTSETEPVLPMVKQLPSCEESEDNDIIQWVNVDKGHHDYSVISWLMFKQKLTPKKAVMQISELEPVSHTEGTPALEVAL